MDGSNQWYMAIGGHQVGPVSQQEIITNLQNGSIDAETLVFSAGMTQWQKVKDVAAFAPSSKDAAGAAAGQAAARPAAFVPPPAPGRRAHDIDFEILGNEMQFVEVALDPGEGAVAEAGRDDVHDAGHRDGDDLRRRQPAALGRRDGRPARAGKRVLTGERLFMTVFTNGGGSGKQKVAFAAPYPGKIIPIDLSELGGQLVCQKDSFLCAAKGVSVGIAFQKRLGAGLFGGEGFIMQKLEGDGLGFVHAGGTIHDRDLAAGETMRVDTGCLVALQPSVNYDIQFVGGIKTLLFGGEGLFFATLQGPGRVWLQSLPLSRMADRIYAAAPQSKGWRKEEGSILDRVGGLGDLIDGR